MFELAAGIGIALILIAFLAEYVDSTLGMGYGTTLTPLLMMLGFEPLQIVPAVLLSELITGLLAGFTHHSMGNVEFFPNTIRFTTVLKRLKYVPTKKGIQRGWAKLPVHLRITLVIALCSIVGTVLSVFLALNLPAFYVKLYIGMLVLAIGVVILATMKAQFRFSWLRIIGLGMLASFNKGISGGGYGPVVTGGQLLAGVQGKNAIGITSLAEGLTCIVGVVAYLAVGTGLDWTLAPYLCIGAVLSVPLSCMTVRIMSAVRLRIGIGIFTLLLGAYTLWKLLF
ncbi:MAG: TSUP family transporter [Chitinivibrionales bacterium]|nr:TSUP family transporter [Chitinivibrionales bacterium]MBD3394998.1 TSUP family transporter [Chitinivibrionales bacterium]